MTVPLRSDSPRAASALRFGQELSRAMAARHASRARLAVATGCSKASIANWRVGGNLPRVDTAARLAEALDWPKLVAIAATGRTGTCPACGRPFINEGGAFKRWCSVACREVATQLRRPTAGGDLATAIEAQIVQGAGKHGGLPRAPLSAAIALYRRSDARRVMRIDKQHEQVVGLQALVDAMCASCEPEGVCRTPECPLRAASPLPIGCHAVPDRIRPAEGPWGPTSRDRTLAAGRAGNAERWSRPGERDRMSAASSARWAALTPTEREAAGAAISKGRGAS